MVIYKNNFNKSVLHNSRVTSSNARDAGNRRTGHMMPCILRYCSHKMRKTRGSQRTSTRVSES